MATENINVKVNTGAVNVILRDEFEEEIGSFKFIPTDLDIAERFDKAISEFENIKVSENVSLNEFTEITNKIKGIFDYLLNYKVSDTLFKVCNPLTPVNNGDFYLEVCLETIANLIEEIFNKRIEKKKARIQKATSKYTKKK